MAYLLSSERPTMAAAQSPTFSFFGWLAKVRAARAQRRALKDLLDFDSALLDDLGINRQDLYDAMQSPRSGQTLAQRRATAARHWLNP